MWKNLIIASLLAVVAPAAMADLLVRTDGTIQDGKALSHDSKEVVFLADGQLEKYAIHVERSQVTRLLITDDHGALLRDAFAPATQPARHWNVPPEPAAPSVSRIHDPHSYFLIPLHGEVGDTVLASALEKSLADAVARRPSVVVLDIDSPGGLVEEAQKIMKVIHHYNKQIRIVALTDKDLSAAAIFSLSVKEIYVKSTSTIGAATSFQPNNLTLPPKIEEKMQSAWRAVARNSAEEGEHEPLLSEAMIDNDIELHLDTSGGKPVVAEGSGPKMLCKKGKILTLSSHEAIECGLALGEADDIDELGTVLKMSGWKECKGLGTLLAGYLPKKTEAFKAESTEILSHLQQNFQKAKESDPAQVITRVVRTGPQFPMPGPHRIFPNRFQPPQPPIMNGNTTVVSGVSHTHWKARSLACVVALQQVELNLGEEKALSEAYGQQGLAEVFAEAQTQLGAVRAQVYDDRNKYGPGTTVAAAPQTPAPPQLSQTPQSNTQPPATAPSRTSTARLPHVFDRRMPTGAVQTEVIGGPGGGPFVHANPVGGPVVGFHYAMGSWGGKSVLRFFDPLYTRPTAPDDPTLLLARDGYVVGGLSVQKNDVNVISIRVTFVRFKDGAVNAADTYASDWIGTHDESEVHELSGKGATVIGTCGHKGLNLDAVGLVLMPTK